MIQFDEQGANLVFLISLPRSGSTLLQRVLGGHPDIATLAEPWLMLHPLYALKRGGIDAEYDANLARQALDDFLAQVEGGEDAYIQGIRRFAGDLYANILSRQSKRLFLDKTPRYYRIIPELHRVFPRARFVFLLRNPLAILASTLHAWFEGNPALLQDTTNHNDLLDGPGLLLSALAEFGDEAIVVRYDELVLEPERVISELCGRLDLDFHPTMLEYGDRPAPPGSFGDQIGIMQHSHPSGEYRDKWAGYLTEEGRRAFALEYLEQLGDAQVAALGYDAVEMRQALAASRSQYPAAGVDDSSRAQADRLNTEGEARYALGDIESAYRCFEQACDLDPDFPTPHNNLMVLLWESGETQAALSRLADRLEHVPLDRDLIINGVQMLVALGLTDEAGGLCARYLDDHPDDETVRALLGTPEVPPIPESPVPQAKEAPSAEPCDDSAPGVVTIATSIAPKGIENQQRAIASWQALGFRVVSLNSAGEIVDLRANFPQVDFVEVTRHGAQLAGKPYVFLDDVLAYLHDSSGSRICGVVNSDIILRAATDLPAYLSREAENALVYGSRVDIRGAEDADGSLYHRGFDFFFFDRAVIGRLPKTNFMLGVPWWDYWVPIGFQRAGVQIKRLDSRIAMHVWHATNYSTEVLLKFGREFTEHCAPVSFLAMYEQCQEKDYGNAAFSVLSDVALDYINRNTSKISFPGASSTEPMHGERPRVSVIVSTYKSAAFIGECLQDLIGQTIADRIEVIVIDAASPENEREIVAEYQRRFPHIPIRYQRTDKRIGVYAAWNLAAHMARGDYLISCSTNDRLRRDACEILARTLDEQPDVALVYGNSFMTQRPHQEFESADLCSLYLWTDYRYEDLIDRCMVGPHPMWRRSVHEKIGYFEERYIALGDQEFWLRLGEQEKLLNIPDFTGLYYVSEDSLTGNGDIAKVETDAIHAQYQWRFRYAQWRQLADQRQATHVNAETQPSLHVLILVPPGGMPQAADTLDALGAQNYTNLQVSIFADQPPPDPSLLTESGLNWLCYPSLKQLPALVDEAAGSVSSEWLWLIDAGDRLAADALADAAGYALTHPEWRMMYFDDDRLNDGGRMHSPRFKPDFNLNLLRCQPYIGGCLLIRPQTLHLVGGLATLADWRGADLALRVVDKFSAEAVGHIPRLLVHYAERHKQDWQVSTDGPNYQDSLVTHLQRHGLKAEISVGQAEDTLRLRCIRHDQPLVSVILFGGSVAERLLSLQTLLSKTGYANFEVLVLQLDNERKLDIDASPQSAHIRVVSVSSMQSGASLNNAAQMARGEYLLWLDGRCLVLQQDWIERLLAQATETDVGVVGARLVDRNKMLIDAGVILGLGTRGVGARVNIGLHMNSSGYMARAQCEQDLSAVTSLCMLVRTTAFHAVGGFAQDLMTGLYRDIDFCLKVQTEDLRTVWTPSATLMFLGDNLAADRPPREKSILDLENTRVLERWFQRIVSEPAYNRNLSHLRTDYQLELNTVPNWEPVVDTLPRVLGFGVGSYGSWQYRVVQPLNELNISGFANCTNTKFPNDNQIILPTFVDMEHLQPDTLLMHNTLHDSHLEALSNYKKYNDVFVVFGQDDLMFALPPKNPYSKTVYKDIKKRIRKCAELADRLVVTTEPLAMALAEMSRDVRVVPNYLSGSLWGELHSLRRQGRKPRVGWAGAQQHGGDLEVLLEVVMTTAEEVDWIFFGMCPEALRPYVKEIHRPVAFDEYPAKLATLNLDLAVAPLERNRFNEAKSNLRILEYGVLGWPVIASDIHPYQTGPICRVPNNPTAWIRAIREHLSDLDALGRAGDSLQSWVKTHWMLEDHLGEWFAALGLGVTDEVVAPLREGSIRF